MTLTDALLTLKNVKPARVKHSLDHFSQIQSDDTDHNLSPIELWPIETAESVRPSKAAQQKPLQFCKIAGPFSVIVYYNEKCQFACWCSNTKCICNYKQVGSKVVAV